MRLNSIPNASDAVANDVVYHLKCWVTAQKQIEPQTKTQEIDNFNQVVCDIELINLIRHNLNNPSGIVMDMNTLNKKYIELLQENNIDKDLLKSNYKIYIEQLIINN